MDTKLLDKVRIRVLKKRALGQSVIGLSSIVYTGENRGHVHGCLSLLAREGIMFSRRAPEPCVASYDHGEVDKRFRFRISKDEAAAKLTELGEKVPQPMNEYEWRNPYIHPTLYGKKKNWHYK